MSSRAFQPREPRYFLLGRMRAIERAAHRAMLEAIQEAGYPYMRTPHIALMAHMTPEGLRITELADLMQVTKSAASQLVTWLDRHGLVERVPDPADRRATLVRATSAADAGFRAARHESVGSASDVSLNRPDHGRYEGKLVEASPRAISTRLAARSWSQIDPLR